MASPAAAAAADAERVEGGPSPPGGGRVHRLKVKYFFRDYVTKVKLPGSFRQIYLKFGSYSEVGADTKNSICGLCISDLTISFNLSDWHQQTMELIFVGEFFFKICKKESPHEEIREFKFSCEQFWGLASGVLKYSQGLCCSRMNPVNMVYIILHYKDPRGQNLLLFADVNEGDNLEDLMGKIRRKQLLSREWSIRKLDRKDRSKRVTFVVSANGISIVKKKTCICHSFTEKIKVNYLSEEKHLEVIIDDKVCYRFDTSQGDDIRTHLSTYPEYRRHSNKVSSDNSLTTCLERGDPNPSAHSSTDNSIFKTISERARYASTDRLLRTVPRRYSWSEYTETEFENDGYMTSYDDIALQQCCSKIEHTYINLQQNLEKNKVEVSDLIDMLLRKQKPPNILQLSEKETQNLCTYFYAGSLDKQWEDFAGKLGITNEDVAVIKNFSHEHNILASKVVLYYWEFLYANPVTKGRVPVCSRENLMSLLTDLGRMDLVLKLQIKS